MNWKKRFLLLLGLGVVAIAIPSFLAKFLLFSKFGFLYQNIVLLPLAAVHGALLAITWLIVARSCPYIREIVYFVSACAFLDFWLWHPNTWTGIVYCCVLVLVHLFTVRATSDNNA